MKSCFATSFTLLSLMLMIPSAGCAVDSQPEPDPTTTAPTPEEMAQREKLYEGLKESGKISLQCSKGDFICCNCEMRGCDCLPN